MSSDSLVEEAPVVLLGDPRLRRVSAAVDDPSAPDVIRAGARLAATLEAFRRRHGFGRAMAAPQIGIARRMIALNVGQGPRIVFNPVVTWASSETLTMWDDCMSFPDLMVRVSRSRSVSVRFTDEKGEEREWERLDAATSELLQHEIDHLDGVLAVDRAIDREAIVLRAAFEANREIMLSRVDYVISAPAYRWRGATRPDGPDGARAIEPSRAVQPRPSEPSRSPAHERRARRTAFLQAKGPLARPRRVFSGFGSGD